VPFEAVQQEGVAGAAQGRQIVVVRAEKELNAGLHEARTKLAREHVAPDVVVSDVIVFDDRIIL
jgi:hypothetical protein